MHLKKDSLGRTEIVGDGEFVSSGAFVGGRFAGKTPPWDQVDMVFGPEAQATAANIGWAKKDLAGI